ncbi:PTS glucitol/sorbitol transporter subunit IIA [Lapidilactobacillus luobeiensis]|uniref:PTS glucitol/sorbitol transporter subunit IIA n=1 Tax=Lapidilactobacillus luobeiensis TaxID=2950371 RepID=UPI0021C40648|nr:PTS glucitol/sorbitol transporter subunit IIA [Lapidilactobacillus luobeiensis]
MDIKAEVTAIGPQALTSGDPMVILFNETASAALREVAVIQKFTDLAAAQKMTITVGDSLTIGSQTYPIKSVGKLVNDNLRSIGHVTLVFDEAAPLGLQNALHFAKQPKPSFTVGTPIIYHCHENEPHQ